MVSDFTNPKQKANKKLLNSLIPDARTLSVYKMHRTTEGLNPLSLVVSHNSVFHQRRQGHHRVADNTGNKKSDSDKNVEAQRHRETAVGLSVTSVMIVEGVHIQRSCRPGGLSGRPSDTQHSVVHLGQTSPVVELLFAAVSHSA